MNGLGLCAGVGGIELGLKLVFGDSYRALGYVEREAYCCEVLARRMEEGHLDVAPIWDDLATFDGNPYRGKVDILTAGLPCQPYSQAGRGDGDQDKRALWPHFVRVVRECEPEYVFLENVPPFLDHAERMWRELRGMGFEFAPPAIVTARECGAPHRRRRLFILATHPGRKRSQGELPPRTTPRAARRVGGESTHPYGDGLLRKRGGWVRHNGEEKLRHDANRCDAGCRTCGTPWAVESPVFRVGARDPRRVDELVAIGNSVVPAMVVCAFERLYKK